MVPRLFQVPQPTPGSLATMARPRGGDWLDEEVRGLAAYGIDDVVSLLTSAEEAELDLTGERRAVLAAGLRFHRLRTPDRGVPEVAAFRQVTDLLLQRLQDGASVVVHCRFGIGRASTVAAGVLMLAGVKPSDAWLRIEKARGIPVPDNEMQRRFVDGLAGAHADIRNRAMGPVAQDRTEGHGSDWPAVR